MKIFNTVTAFISATFIILLGLGFCSNTALYKDKDQADTYCWNNHYEMSVIMSINSKAKYVCIKNKELIQIIPESAFEEYNDD